MKSRLFLLIFMLLSVGSLLAVSQKDTVYAAAPECYRQLNGGRDGSPITRARCNRDFKEAVAEATGRNLQNALRNDKCYLLVPTTGRVEERPRDGDVCQGWRYFGGEVPAGNGNPTRGGGNAGNFEIENPDRDANLNCSGTAECIENNSLVHLLKAAIQFFTVAVGVIITIIIIWSAFGYTHAGGDPNKTSEEKTRIRNAIIALAIYIFLGAGLNWAIPGGLF